MLLRSLVVWLMLLAMPFQGYASATMLSCAPSAHDAAMTMPAAMAGVHDHAAMMAALDQTMHEPITHDHAAHDPVLHDHVLHDHVMHDHAGDGAGHHDHGKCGNCAACCAGAVLASTAIIALPPELGGVSGPLSYYTDFLPAVDLAHPERPPQSPRA